jgi:hypothetical protein
MMKIGQNWRNSILARETIRRANESFAALPDVLIAPGQSGRSFPFGNSKRLVRRSPRNANVRFIFFALSRTFLQFRALSSLQRSEKKHPNLEPARCREPG